MSVDQSLGCPLLNTVSRYGPFYFSLGPFLTYCLRSYGAYGYQPASHHRHTHSIPVIIRKAKARAGPQPPVHPALHPASMSSVRWPRTRLRTNHWGAPPSNPFNHPCNHRNHPMPCNLPHGPNQRNFFSFLSCFVFYPTFNCCFLYWFFHFYFFIFCFCFLAQFFFLFNPNLNSKDAPNFLVPWSLNYS